MNGCFFGNLTAAIRLHWSLYHNLYNLPFWRYTTGFLDSTGRAVFEVFGSNDPKLLGLQLHACFFVVDPTAPSSMSTISNHVTLVIN